MPGAEKYIVDIERRVDQTGVLARGWFDCRRLSGRASSCSTLLTLSPRRLSLLWLALPGGAGLKWTSECMGDEQDNMGLAFAIPERVVSLSNSSSRANSL